MAQARISVAMCTYNGSRFLPEQLGSIAKQTRLPDEMVVCDDGSTDATPEIIEDFARSVPFPVRFFRNAQNLGSTKNFEQAIGLCTGDLIALSDQDDIWLPEKLARQAEMLERDPTLGGVFTDGILVDDNSKPIGKKLWASHSFTPREQRLFQRGKTLSVLLRKNVVTGATLMVRASVRPLFSPIPNVWIHDGWIAWMLTLYSSLGLLREPLVKYRIHGLQQVGVESLTLSMNLTLVQRLKKGKREDAAKHQGVAEEFAALEERLNTTADLKSRAVLPEIRQRIVFFTERGSPYTNRFSRIVWILSNLAGYYRYESGWRVPLRDIVIIFV